MDFESRYPIGIQDFAKLRESGMVYVDKTRYIGFLTQKGGYYFLSRPRRFGKSLFLSTLAAFYQGRRDLFRGLAAEHIDWDWQPRPVLYVDLNNGDYSSPLGLESKLNDILGKWEREYGVTPPTDDVAVRFGNVIQQAAETTGYKVVILVDEYDKPLLATVDDKERADRFRDTLKAFYSNLKTMDRFIELGFLTGVARFGKVSIFSDLNNLNDISMSEDFAQICGWSERELVDNFRPGIETLGARIDRGFDDTVAALRTHYDGYRFTLEDTKLYNPFSVLNALYHKRIKSYWFATGTPTFLVKRIRRQNPPLRDLNSQWCSEDELTEQGLESRNPIPLLFQTGYLTIKEYEDDTQSYRLGFPNREVENGFDSQLLRYYVPEDLQLESQFNTRMFQRDLADGQPEQFMLRLGALLKDMPYECHNERTYQNLVYLLCQLSGSGAQLERHTNIDRTDLEVRTSRYIYIFEFKYNRTVGEAMAQLRERDYAGRFALDRRTVYLIAANFSASAPHRGLTSYQIDPLNTPPIPRVRF